MITMSVTEAVRNFADLVNRVFYRGERFTLERGGRAVARVVPVPRAGRLGDLPSILENAPRLDSADAEAFAREIEEGRRLLTAPGSDAWER